MKGDDSNEETVVPADDGTEAPSASEAADTPPAEPRSAEQPERPRAQTSGDTGRNGRHASPDEEVLDEDDSDGFTHEGQAEYEQDDPLAPAFDLDEGTPLGRGRGQNRPPDRAEIKSAKEFFNGEILYRFDILEDEARNDLAGRYRIELKGFQGGIWTINVGLQLEIVNRREDAEIVLTMQQRDFLQLVNGELNPQLAVFAQKMRINGDLRKAVAFQALLAPEGVE